MGGQRPFIAASPGAHLTPASQPRALSAHMRRHRDRGMAAYSELQQQEFAAEAEGYSATRHQREVGTGYFDAVTQAITQGRSSTVALVGSTEEAQF